MDATVRVSENLSVATERKLGAVARTGLNVSGKWFSRAKHPIWWETQ
jgi:hypothetical protein